MKPLQNYLLYAGLEKDDFDSLIPDAMESNQHSMQMYSLIAAIAFAILLVSSSLTADFTDVNHLAYSFFVLYNAAIYACVRFLVPKIPAATLPLSYLFMGGLYAFSLTVTALHPEYPAVSTIVLLFAGPFLLNDRPIRLVGMTTVTAIALCLVSLVFKTSELAYVDFWNCISFTVVAVVVETLQTCDKFKMLHQERKIAMLSKTDVLTGVRNRNHYEMNLHTYPDLCNERLMCVFADVNGLHELNNTEGHAAGDRLLQAAAKALIEAFEEEHIYRVGGDEFICFQMDLPDDEVRERMAKAERDLAEQGYFISWGASSAEKSGIEIGVLTHDAEVEMYAAKQRFYQKAGRDRRRR